MLIRSYLSLIVCLRNCGFTGTIIARVALKYEVGRWGEIIKESLINHIFYNTVRMFIFMKDLGSESGYISQFHFKT